MHSIKQRTFEQGQPRRFEPSGKGPKDRGKVILRYYIYTSKDGVSDSPREVFRLPKRAVEEAGLRNKDIVAIDVIGEQVRIVLDDTGGMKLNGSREVYCTGFREFAGIASKKTSLTYSWTARPRELILTPDF